MCNLDEATLNTFLPRSQQIAMCELMAGPIVLWNHGSSWAGRDVIWWVDNEAVLSCLVKGTSSQGDMPQVAAITHVLLAKYGIRAWFEWVSSASNASDGLSRDGLQDMWTLQQNWVDCEAALPPWGDLASLPLRYLTSWDSQQQ